MGAPEFTSPTFDEEVTGEEAVAIVMAAARKAAETGAQDDWDVLEALVVALRDGAAEAGRQQGVRLDKWSRTEWEMSEDNDVTTARIVLGLPRNRFHGYGGGVGPGMPIVCKCVHCLRLFVGASHDLADLDHICRGDCGCANAGVTISGSEAGSTLP